MLKTVTEKMLEKGIPVKGLILTKNSVVVLQEDDVTAYIAEWPGAENITKINVSVTTEDMEGDGEDVDGEEYSEAYDAPDDEPENSDDDDENKPDEA